MISQYLITVRMIAAGEVVGKVRECLREKLLHCGLPQIAAVRQVYADSSDWNPATDEAKCGLVAPTYVTCRMMASFGEEEDIPGFCETLRTKIAELVDPFQACRVLDVGSVEDPITEGLLAPKPNGLVAATNQIVCTAPPYVR